MITQDCASGYPAYAKQDVDEDDWETVATYNCRFADDSMPLGEGECTVEVQVGSVGGVWFLRTEDDAGGDDDAPDTSYASRKQAEEAAREFAEANDEPTIDETEREYLEEHSGGKYRIVDSQDGEPWEESFDDRTAADLYVTRWFRALYARHPNAMVSLMHCPEVESVESADDWFMD